MQRREDEGMEEARIWPFLIFQGKAGEAMNSM
jgi:hypothetical protein